MSQLSEHREYSCNNCFSVLILTSVSVLDRFQLIYFFSLSWVIFSYFFTCLVIGCQTLWILSCWVLDIFVCLQIFLSFFGEEREVEMQLTCRLFFQILSLRFVGQYQSSAPPRGNYSNLLKQYPSELSQEDPMNHQVFPVWPVGILCLAFCEYWALHYSFQCFPLVLPPI